MGKVKPKTSDENQKEPSNTKNPGLFLFPTNRKKAPPDIIYERGFTTMQQTMPHVPTKQTGSDLYILLKPVIIPWDNRRSGSPTVR